MQYLSRTGWTSRMKSGTSATPSIGVIFEGGRWIAFTLRALPGFVFEWLRELWHPMQAVFSPGLTHVKLCIRLHERSFSSRAT
jgi:hypothetical protein